MRSSLLDVHPTSADLGDVGLQHARYTCTFCGKDSVKRTAVGIWHCKACRKTVAGGAWTVSTAPAITVRRWAPAISLAESTAADYWMATALYDVSESCTKHRLLHAVRTIGESGRVVCNRKAS